MHSVNHEVKEILPKQLTARKRDFSRWYDQVLSLADIIDKRYEVKGMFVWKSYGIKLMKSIKTLWDKLFEENDIHEMYFPLIVPLEYAMRNREWFSGFKDSVFWVLLPGRDEAKHILRPTGEPAIYPMFKLWIKSRSDLPIRVYQTVSSFRYETRQTRPLIRDREITFWYEIHTAHASRQEAENELKKHMEINDEIWRNLAISPIKVEKPRWEVFPGAIGAIEYYVVMPDGRLLENGSCNNLGQAYSKKYEITFRDKDGRIKYVWQICTGNGARYLAAVVSLHGDDRGLIIPPSIAPIQVIIIPIYFKDKISMILKEARKLLNRLKKSGVRVELDDRLEIRTGEKFFIWEIKGVPIRIEIGPIEIENNFYTVFRRDTFRKEQVSARDISSYIKKLLKEIQVNLLNRVKRFYSEVIVECSGLEDLKTVIKTGRVAKVYWCESRGCWDTINSLELGVEIVGSLVEDRCEGKCIVCGKKAFRQALVGRTY